jgi:hypothetical protein
MDWDRSREFTKSTLEEDDLGVFLFTGIRLVSDEYMRTVRIRGQDPTSNLPPSALEECYAEILIDIADQSNMSVRQAADELVALAQEMQMERDELTQ